MRLKNRETGEIPEKIETIAYVQWSGKIMMVYINSGGERITKQYDSLGSFNEEWADYNKEPGEYWFVAGRGVVEHALATGDENDPFDKGHKELGNYFDTYEKAKQVVEKLQAFKRLKDMGFRFYGWRRNQTGTYDLLARWADRIPRSYEVKKDLNILFSGEDD